MKEIIKLGTNNSKNIRVVKDEYTLNQNEVNSSIDDIHVTSYLVQIQIFFIWFTIKEYSFGYRINDDNSIEYITRGQDYCKLCAEELYDHIIKDE